MFSNLSRIFKIQQMSDSIQEKDPYQLTLEAYNALEDIVLGNIAMRLSLEWMANDASLQTKLVTSAKIKLGFPSAKSEDAVQSIAERLGGWIVSEQQHGFHAVKKSATVAACAAFENLAKSFFVEWALHDVSLVDKALSKKVELSGHDFLLNETDRLFILADFLYRVARGKDFFEKIDSFVLTTVPSSHQKFLKEFNQAARSDFNEAFAVRNCIVHRAAHVDQRLALITQETVGEAITFEKGRMNRINGALLKAGNALNSCSALLDVL